MRKRWFIRVVRFAAIAAVAITVFSFVVMNLWNWLVPPIVGWHSINFWQALGLLVLSKILFGGIRGGPWRGMHWRHRMMERWQQMTPEEREKLRDGMRERCGGRSATEQQTAQG